MGDLGITIALGGISYLKTVYNYWKDNDMCFQSLINRIFILESPLREIQKENFELSPALAGGIETIQRLITDVKTFVLKYNESSSYRMCMRFIRSGRYASKMKSLNDRIDQATQALSVNLLATHEKRRVEDMQDMKIFVERTIKNALKVDPKDSNAQTVMKEVSTTISTLETFMNPMSQSEQLLVSNMKQELENERLVVFEIIQQSLNSISEDMAHIKSVLTNTYHSNSSRNIRDETVRTLKLRESDLTLNKNYLLGSGGFSKVYYGENYGAPVAIKVIKAKGEGREENGMMIKELKKIENEALLTNDVGSKCAHVIHCYGFVHQEDLSTSWLVLELSIGSVSNLLAEQILPSKITLPLLLSWMMDASRGVAYLHRRHIIHKDIKGQNYLVCMNPYELIVKIGDFGISKDNNSITAGTTTNLGGAGTAAFQAVEIRMTHNTTKSNYATDVYSLGMTFLQMLLGTVPDSNIWTFQEQIESALSTHESCHRSSNAIDNDGSGSDDIGLCLSLLKELIFSMLSMDMTSHDQDTDGEDDSLDDSDSFSLLPGYYKGLEPNTRPFARDVLSTITDIMHILCKGDPRRDVISLYYGDTRGFIHNIQEDVKVKHWQRMGYTVEATTQAIKDITVSEEKLSRKLIKLAKPPMSDLKEAAGDDEDNDDGKTSSGSGKGQSKSSKSGKSSKSSKSKSNKDKKKSTKSVREFDVEATIMAAHPSGKLLCLAATNDMIFSGGGQSTLGGGGEVKVWSRSTYQNARTLRPGHWKYVNQIVIDSKQGKLYTGSSDNSIKIYNMLNDFKLLKTITAHKMGVTSIAYHNDALISASYDKKIKVYSGCERMLYNEERTLLSHDAGVTSVVINPLQNAVISASADWTICVHSLSDYGLHYRIKKHDDVVNCLSLMKNLLASGSDDKTINIYDMNDQYVVLHTIEEHYSIINSITFDIRNGLLFTGGNDKRCKVFDSSNDFAYMTDLEPHEGVIYAVICASKDRYLTAGADGTIKAHRLVEV